MISKIEIKHINALKVKKYRNKYSEFIAEGDKIIKELIEEGLQVVNIFTINENSILQNKNIKVVSDAELSMISALTKHHGSLAVFRMQKKEMQIANDEWILLLDDIQDPGNMGTIIRTCDWFGIKKIICSDGCVDVYNPKVVQASMASIGRVQVMEADLKEIIQEYKMSVYGAILNGKNYNEQSFKEKGFILIGNEGHGINNDLETLITYRITIPKKGRAESLNAAIATALILDKLSI
ncbi:MAG: methyltransferase [Bacteroidota bacterium]|nr:methyltransferase [Bacteroidota bacterium]